MIFEFNKVHASGQGLSGYTEMLSEQRIDNVNLPLDEAGLPFTPVHGSFQVQVINKKTGATQTHDVFVRLNGLDDDTTYDDLAHDAGRDQRAFGHHHAGRTIAAGERVARTWSSSFANDSSGVLAALGLDTFFSGTTAEDMRVQAALLRGCRQAGNESRGRRGGHARTANCWRIC